MYFAFLKGKRYKTKFLENRFETQVYININMTFRHPAEKDSIFKMFMVSSIHILNFNEL